MRAKVKEYTKSSNPEPRENTITFGKLLLGNSFIICLYYATRVVQLIYLRNVIYNLMMVHLTH